jgi:hypothetical protein
MSANQFAVRGSEVKSMKAEEYSGIGIEARGSQEVGMERGRDCFPADRGLLEDRSGIWTATRVPLTCKMPPFAALPAWAQPKWL